MSAEWYEPIFLIIVASLGFTLAAEYCLPAMKQYETPNMDLIAIAVAIAIGVWLGLRPINGSYFGDTYNYAVAYEGMNPYFDYADWHGEWLWTDMMANMRKIGVDIHGFMLTVELLYIGSTVLALYRLMPGNLFIALVFVFSSVMFYTYGINGIRNGLACQLSLLSFTYLNKKYLFMYALIAIVAFSIHRSVLLPLGVALLCFLFLRKLSIGLTIWAIALMVSLMNIDILSRLFFLFQFDDRLALYTNATIDMAQFSKTGFRWDFVLYSLPPLVMILFVAKYQKSVDRLYVILANTYCLCNAFWLVLIRLPFSNRIGYLSWFLMPVVISYPLLKFKMFTHQRKITGLLLVSYILLSIFILKPHLP